MSLSTPFKSEVLFDVNFYCIKIRNSFRITHNISTKVERHFYKPRVIKALNTHIRCVMEVVNKLISCIPDDGFFFSFLRQSAARH